MGFPNLHDFQWTHQSAQEICHLGLDMMHLGISTLKEQWNLTQQSIVCGKLRHRGVKKNQQMHTTPSI
jgi:hypothetical protein